jgi:hypothetical protein
MRTTFDSRSVAGIVIARAVFCCAVKSYVAVPDIANPQLPIAVGTRLVLIFGAAAVAHSPSARARLN